jgi:hypothetical protein
MRRVDDEKENSTDRLREFFMTEYSPGPGIVTLVVIVVVVASAPRPDIQNTLWNPESRLTSRLVTWRRGMPGQRWHHQILRPLWINTILKRNEVVVPKVFWRSNDYVGG